MRGLWLTTLMTLNEGRYSTAKRCNRQSLLRITDLALYSEGCHGEIFSLAGIKVT